MPSFFICRMARITRSAFSPSLLCSILPMSAGTICHGTPVTEVERFTGMPVDDLLSNWAYMVMSSLAWNLKAWFGLLLPNSQRGIELIKMEFRRFLHAIVLLPAQIVRTGRRVIYRIMSYNGWLKDLFSAWEHVRWLRAT
jgi:hypothetical protein